jgi:DNA-binding LacI/PurR family transcriptional regulator
MPTAVLAFNDRSAVGLIDTVVRAGIAVPATLSVVGYDDSPIARLAHIDLTTVSQNTPTLTQHAVTGLIERLDGGRSELREVVVRPNLVIRGTTARPSDVP